MIKLSLLTFLTSSFASSAYVVGYLNKPDYGMQNKFLTNLITRVAKLPSSTDNPGNFTFTFQSFDSVSNLQSCLDSKVCTASLDYEQNIKSSNPTSLVKQPLPVLTDKVMYV
jgi:hypothetical protein